jgi:hypothetical protein
VGVGHGGEHGADRRRTKPCPRKQLRLVPIEQKAKGPLNLWLMETVVLWLIRAIAIASLLPAFFVLWYMAGADDTPRNVVAPLMGLGVMAAAIWGVVAAFRLLPDDPSKAISIFALAPVLFLIGFPFGGTKATGRTPAKELSGVFWLSGPFLLSAAYQAMS